MSKRTHLPVVQDGASASSEACSELMEADLDWDGVDCVLADLDDFVEIREMAGRPASGPPEPMHDLLDARDRFVGGALHGLQITYAFADQVWIDTLLRNDTGARLLRMAAPTGVPHKDTPRS